MSRLETMEATLDRKAPQSSHDVLALSFEFVAKPETTAKVKTQLSVAVAETLREVGGFAGSCVLVSDQESRLVTVITFWAGTDRVKRCAENRRWLLALLKPYLDGGLRGRTCLAHGLHSSPGAQHKTIFSAETEEAFAA